MNFPNALPVDFLYFLAVGSPARRYPHKYYDTLSTLQREATGKVRAYLLPNAQRASSVYLMRSLEARTPNTKPQVPTRITHHDTSQIHKDVSKRFVPGSTPRSAGVLYAREMPLPLRIKQLLTTTENRTPERTRRNIVARTLRT